jgi:RNA polymerase sigma-70 factor, ECF subfamily
MPLFPNGYCAGRAIARDDEIVSAARAGSSGAFAELHAIYSRRLYNTIIAITRNAEDAEDALQDTFLRAYLALNAFEGRASFYSWLTRIAVNSALMVLRKRRSHAEKLFDAQPDTLAETLQFEFEDPAPNPEQTCDQRQRRLMVLCAIRNLSPRLREPIEMQLMKDYSIQDIGRALNITVTAAKTRLHRARAQLFALCEEAR